MYSISTFWHWSIWLLLFHIAVITPSPDSRFVLHPSPYQSSLSWPRNTGHIESILSQVQIKYSPLESPPVRIWSTIWTEVNQGSSDRAEKGSEAQTGNEKLLQPRFSQGHFLKLKISPIQPYYKLLYKFLNYEQFMTWWVLSVWELYYYSKGFHAS